MIISNVTSAAPTATRARMSAPRMAAPREFALPMVASALPLGDTSGASVEGRHLVADIAYTTAVRVPAAGKDVFVGVRAWSPPI